MAAAVRVNGLRELNRALKHTSKDVRLGIRKELKDVAEPIRRDAEGRALGEISHLGVPWSRMRTGLTAKTMYVAPKERGVRQGGNPALRRKKLAGRLMDDAMQPALDSHAGEVEREFDQMLGRVSERFSRG